MLKAHCFMPRNHHNSNTACGHTTWNVVHQNCQNTQNCILVNIQRPANIAVLKTPGTTQLPYVTSPQHDASVPLA